MYAKIVYFSIGKIMFVRLSVHKTSQDWFYTNTMGNRWKGYFASPLRDGEISTDSMVLSTSILITTIRVRNDNSRTLPNIRF